MAAQQPVPGVEARPLDSMPAPVSRMPELSQSIWTWRVAALVLSLWAWAMLFGPGIPDHLSPPLLAQTTACESKNETRGLECLREQPSTGRLVTSGDSSEAPTSAEPEEEPTLDVGPSQQRFHVGSCNSFFAQHALLPDRHVYFGRAPPGNHA